MFIVPSEWPVTFQTIVIEMAKYKCLPDIKPINVSCTCCTTGPLLYYTESYIHSHKVKGHESTTTSGLGITTDIDLFSLRIIVSSHGAKSAHLFWPWFVTISLNSTMCCERMIKGYFALIIKSPWIFPDSQVLVS